MEDRKNNVGEVCVPTEEMLEGTRPVEIVAGTTGKAEPEKRLIGEEILRCRKYIVIPVFVLVFLAALCLVFVPSGDSRDTVEGDLGFSMSVPDPTVVQLEESERDVHEKRRARQEKGRRMLSLSDLTGRLPEDKGRADSVSTPNSSIRQSADTYRDITKQLESFYETPQERVSNLEEKVGKLGLRLEKAEAENLRAESRERMMEQPCRMTAKHLNTQPETTLWGATEEGKPEPVPVSRVKTGTTSAPEQPVMDSVFVASLTVGGNYGFDTAVSSGYRVDMSTTPARISESQTLEQGGRVKLHLLEPLQAGSITVLANSLVTSTADIRGERLDILVSGIEYAGNIILVQLTTYDIDGQRDIFVPESENRTAVEGTAGDVSQSMRGSISFAGSVGQQVTMDLTRDILRGGARFISQRVKAVRVKLKTGYKVLLVAKKQ